MVVFHCTDLCTRPHLESNILQVCLEVVTPPPHNGKITDTMDTKKKQQQQQQQQQKQQNKNNNDLTPILSLFIFNCPFFKSYKNYSTPPVGGKSSYIVWVYCFITSGL